MQGLQSAELLFEVATKASRSQEKRTEGRRIGRFYQSKASPTNERVKARRRTGGFAEGAVRYDVARVRARARDGTGRVGK